MEGRGSVVLETVGKEGDTGVLLLLIFMPIIKNTFDFATILFLPVNIFEVKKLCVNVNVINIIRIGFFS